jgi:LmbE family N-acetylglucosaminyl deacetylase
MSGLLGPKLVLRRIVASHMRRRARRRSEPLGEPGGATLVVAPHEDDCALGCGGLLSARSAAGCEVRIAYLTDGAASHPGHPRVPPHELARMRVDEARLSARILGVPAENLAFLGAPDGGLPHLEAQARKALVGSLAGLLSGIGAGEVLVTSAGDGSSEHAAANAIVRDAVALSGAGRIRVLEYPVWSVWSPLRLGPQVSSARRIHRLALSPELLGKKCAALREFRSQYLPLEPWDHAVLPEGFLGLFEVPEEFFFEY